MIGIYIFLSIGVFLFIIGLVMFIKGERTNNWKPIVGRINNVEIGSSRDEDNVMSYICLVDYEYDSPKGNGIIKGDKIAMGYLSTNHKKAHYDIKEKLESSKKVKLWVDPKNENRAVIAKGVNKFPFFFFVFGLMFILFALGMMPYADGNNTTPSKSVFPKIEILEFK